MKKPRLNYANVVATLALFIGLGGVSWAAATLPRNSVGRTQVRDSAISAPKLSAVVRERLNLSPDLGRNVLSKDKMVLGELYGRGTVPFAPVKGAATFQIRTSSGAVIERTVATGQRVPRDNRRNSGGLFYLNSTCTGPTYLDSGDSQTVNDESVDGGAILWIQPVSQEQAPWSVYTVIGQVITRGSADVWGRDIADKQCATYEDLAAGGQGFSVNLQKVEAFTEKDPPRGPLTLE